MIRYAHIPRKSRLALLLFLALLTITSLSAYASDVRYNGVILTTTSVATEKINETLPDTYGEIGSQLVLLGIEGVAGEVNGWVVGGFGYKGKLASTDENDNLAEFGVALAGVTVETLILQQSTREITAGARLGGGRYSLRLVQVDHDDNIDSIADAATIATTTTLESPVWYLEPSLGLRSRLGDFLVLEGRVGYGISMSNGEWRYNGKSIDHASIQLGGFVLSVGIKAISF